MTGNNRFPFIHVIQNGSATQFQAIAAFELKSLLLARLCAETTEQESGFEESMNAAFKRRKERREGFLHAISAWPSHLFLELRILAFPSIACIPHGRLSLHILLRANGDNETELRETVATHCLNLQPILLSHMPEAEFVPVFEIDRLERVLKPFDAGYGLSIGHLRQSFPLSTPYNRLSIGFENMAEVGTSEEDYTVDHLFPWLPTADSWETFLNTLMGRMEPTLFLTRISSQKPSSAILDGLQPVVNKCEEFLGGANGESRMLARQARMIRDSAVRRLAELNHCCFDLGSYLAGESKPDLALANIVGRSLSRFASEDDANYFEGGFSIKEVDPGTVLFSSAEKKSDFYTLSEAASALRLPDPPRGEIPGLQVLRSRTCAAFVKPDSKEPASEFQLFVNKHRGISQPIKVIEEDRFRHFFILGQTGTGKSTLMEQMILQDICAGKGCAVIDPHGELVEPLLGKIPKEREKDTIYFNLLDRERPMGFNILEFHDATERDLIIDELFLTLDRIYDMKLVGGPMFENNYRSMCQILTGAKTANSYTPTLLEFTLCYQERKFRKWLKKQISNPQLLDFLGELEETGGEASLHNISSYITSKFARFVQDSTLRLIIGQERTSFDFDEVMNNGKILLVNLAKGRFGPNISALLANQIVTRFKHAAMKRGGMNPEKRVPFHLYVDECHNLPPENFAELLSEARKYRLSLTLATQYASQIADESTRLDLLSAVKGNVGTIIVFRLGYQDAKNLAPVFYPDVTSNDIIGLPNYEGYTRMQFGGQAVPPFSFRTQLNRIPYLGETAERVREMSRNHYGRDAKEVEKAILKRRTIWDEKEKQHPLFQ